MELHQHLLTSSERAQGDHPAFTKSRQRSLRAVKHQVIGFQATAQVLGQAVLGARCEPYPDALAGQSLNLPWPVRLTTPHQRADHRKA